MYCTFVLFVNQHFPGATREWDALYNQTSGNIKVITLAILEGRAVVMLMGI
jgi:hypothetical protein